MRVLAIDPGFERLGIAVLERLPAPSISSRQAGDKKMRKEVLIHSECFKTKSSLPFPERLSLLGNRLREIIKKFKPEALAVETLFFTTNQKTAMRVSEARGVIVYEAARTGLPVYEYTPLQIKIAVTGYGKATKEQVNSMVGKLIVIPKKISSDDEMDAIACGITCLAHLKF
ncbi:MAG: crossover junction endodeoxyribonuclease RuvC [Patescibacteria group bacterium]